MREYDPASDGYSGREVVAIVTCVESGWGLDADVVVMGIEVKANYDL